jgi:acyl phosphate:glycerol-3-phosphate acyltransferase
MVMTLEAAGLLLIAYLIGSIPFGLIISKVFYKTDIRQLGSGNPGATNVWRVLGRKPGIATLLLDIVKGAVPVMLSKKFFPWDPPLAIFVGLAAIVGHNWSVFLKFKGGKGVATSAGVFLSLMPLQASLAILGFLVFFIRTRHVSVGSIAGSFVLLLTSFIFPVEPLLKFIIVLAAAMILIKHIPNIKRLAEGSEPKVNFK